MVGMRREEKKGKEKKIFIYIYIKRQKGFIFANCFSYFPLFLSFVYKYQRLGTVFIPRLSSIPLYLFLIFSSSSGTFVRLNFEAPLLFSIWALREIINAHRIICFQCSFDSCGLFFFLIIFCFFSIVGLCSVVWICLFRSLILVGCEWIFVGSGKKLNFPIVVLYLNFGVGLIGRMANRNLEKMASIDAQLRQLVPARVSEDDKLVEYDALLLDRFLDILQDLHGEDLKETVGVEFLWWSILLMLIIDWKKPKSISKWNFYDKTWFNLIFYFYIFVVLGCGAGLASYSRIPGLQFCQNQKSYKNMVQFLIQTYPFQFFDFESYWSLDVFKFWVILSLKLRVGKP